MKKKILILSTALLFVVGGGYLKLKDTSMNANVNAGTLEEGNLVGVYIQIV